MLGQVWEQISCFGLEYNKTSPYDYFVNKVAFLVRPVIFCLRDALSFY